MATGIVSIGTYEMWVKPVGVGLFALTAVAYAVIWVLILLRLRLFPQRVLDDLTDHQQGFGFLTVVAATAVLGAQVILIGHEFAIAVVLLGIAAVLWLALTYAVFTALTIKREKPSLTEGISGTWLLAVVATQSIVVLTTLLAAHWGQPLRLDANFVALSMWLWGGMLYIWIIALIFYRYTFRRFEPDDLAPPYWINMGAMAISALAGALLVENSVVTADAPFLHSMRPFLEGVTVLYWATGTWWIPIIAILAVWRYGYRRLPFEYDPLYWGAVFPLGMYAVATDRMAEALKLEFLEPIPQIFLGLALAAWLATFLGLLGEGVRSWARRG
jgi:tellurite resistance protein TehA-like permease